MNGEGGSEEEDAAGSSILETRISSLCVLDSTVLVVGGGVAGCLAGAGKNSI